MTPVQDAAALAAGPLVYVSVNRPVLQSVPETLDNLLDVGCGGGTFGAAVKSRGPCTVVGVTYSEAEAGLARAHLDHVVVADLNTLNPTSLGQFDCIVCSHVLEHLNDPKRLLRALHGCLKPGGVLVVALPNVLHWKQRLQFMRGRFRYTEGGLMDSTHFRFFDWSTCAELLRDAGYLIHARHADGILPLSRLLGPRLASRLDRSALALLPGLLGTQFILLCQAEPAAAHAAQLARAQ